MNKYKDFYFDKYIIGLLIKYYRKNKNIKVVNLLTRKNSNEYEFCIDCDKCKNRKAICSTKKLYAIERGDVATKDCYYNSLAANLDKQVIFDRRMSNRLINYRNNLKNVLIECSKSKLNKLLIMINKDINKYKNVLYFEDMLSIYLDIINYYLYHIVPSDDSIRLSLYLLEIVDDEDKKIFACFLYEISFRVSNHLIDRDNIKKYCEKYVNDPLLLKYKLEQIVSQNYLDAFESIVEMEKIAVNMSDYQYCCLLEYKAYVLMNAESYEKSYCTLKKCIDIALSKKDFSDYVVINYYGKLGVICFLLEKYAETIESFSVLLSKAAPLGVNCSLLFYSMEKCGMEKQIKDVLKTIDISKKRRPFVEIIVNYYSMRYTEKQFEKNDFILLENMICEDVKPFLKTYGSIQKYIFTNDLKKLVEKTGNYKKYYKFMEK